MNIMPFFFAAFMAAGPAVFTDTSDVQSCAGDVLATSGGLVLGDRVLTAVDGLLGTRVWAVERLGPDQLLVGGEGGLTWLERHDDGWRVERTQSVDAPVRAIVMDGADLLVGTWGLGVLRLSSGTLTPLTSTQTLSRPARRVTAMRRDLSGRVHVATAGGLFMAAGAAVHVATQVLPSRWVLGFQVRDDRLWAKTAGGAVRLNARSHPVAECARVERGGPPSNDISAVVSVGRRLYVGTFDQGLAVYESGRWSRVLDDRLDRRINALAVDKAGVVWVGTARGLTRINGAEVRTFEVADGLASDDVHAVTALRSGGVLAGLGKGAVIINGQQIRSIGRKQRLYVRAVWAATEDRRGGLWLGTSRGLFHRARGKRTFQRYSAATGHLPDDWVTSLRPVGKTLYVGTYAKGVVSVAIGGGEARSLGGGWVNFHGLGRVGGHLAAATMEGLVVRDGAKWRTVAGLPGRDVTGIVEHQGATWVATRRGLIRLAE